MNSNDIIQFGSSIFSLDAIWQDKSKVCQKSILYLSPDSMPYSSRLNPVFSFEFEVEQQNCLKYFDLLSLRDGVYPLMRFFFLNPEPHKADANLIVDARLKQFVPEAWREKTFLRQIYMQEDIFPSKKDELIIIISPDKDSLPMDLFVKELNVYQNQIKDYSKISIYFSSLNKKGEEYAEAETNWGYNLLNKLHENLKNSAIEILDWNDLKTKKVSNASLLEINPTLFNFSDSYIIHELVQKGASLLMPPLLRQDIFHRELISIRHGYALSKFKHEDGPSFFDQSELKALYGDEIRVYSMKKTYRDVKLTTDDFKSYCVKLAEKNYV